MKICLIFFICLLTLVSCTKDKVVAADTTKQSLINDLIEEAKDKQRARVARTQKADKALYLLQGTPDNIEKRKKITDLLTVYRKLKEYHKFMLVSDQGLTLVTAIKDSVGLAEIYFQKGFHYKVLKNLDSAYTYFYQSEKVYRQLPQEAHEHGKALLSMALIQQETADLTQGTTTTIKAIQRFKKSLKGNKYLPNCYGNLGVLSNRLGKYNDAIASHLESLKYVNKEDLAKREVITYNNIAVVYKNMEEYDKAIEYYNRALQNTEYLKTDLKRYALLLDNLAYTRFKAGDSADLQHLFFEPLKIRDSIDDRWGLSTNYLHLSEYHQAKQQDRLAETYARKALKIAKTVNGNKDILEAYTLLSEVAPGKEGLQYAQQYIHLSDSLQQVERAYRDKFARVRFETDEIVEKNEKISRTNTILFITIGSLLGVFLLLYILFQQRQRNKALMFEQSQQEANQEIYRLLLNQQIKIEEGRQLEQQRMSEELHDGVLGRLFGVRLSLDGINERVKDEFTDVRTKYITELKAIEKEIRLISHDLGSDTVSPDVAYVEVIESLISDLCEVHKHKFELINDENIDWDLVENPKKVNLYRIVQESLQNIFKHAKAEFVKISFEYEEDTINLTILDDGIGFNSEKVKRGIGLKNITSRVNQMEGKVEFSSKKDRGTKILVSVPVEIEKTNAARPAPKEFSIAR